MTAPGPEPGTDRPLDLDALLTDPTRLRIVALLSAAERAEFAFVADRTGLSDSALSKQAAALRRAGYLEITKGRVGGRGRTWFALTAQGRARLDAHIRALQGIVRGALDDGGSH